MSDSATALATQQSIKAYVDAQIGANDTLAEILANGNSTGGTDIVVTAGDVITVDTINETTAAGGVTIDGVLIKDNGITATGGGSLTGTWSDLGTVTTVDINGGTIDGSVIGGAAAAAGTFTTLAGTTSVVAASDLTLTSGSIVSASGAISFGNENLSTTGTLDAGAITGTDLIVSNGGGVLIGNAAQIAIDGDTSEFQQLGTVGADTSSIRARYQNGASGVREYKFKSRSGTIGSNSIVADNDELYSLKVFADDGVDNNTNVGNISFNVDDATPAAGAIGAEMVLSLSGTGGTVNTVATFSPDKSTTLAGTLDVSGNTIIGSTSVTPDGTLHVHTASAGAVTANANADDLVVENSANGGISVLVPDASTSSLRLGSPSEDEGAAFSWNYNSGSGLIYTQKTGANLVLYADNAVTNLTLSGASGSELATFAGDVTIGGDLLTINDGTNVNELRIGNGAGLLITSNIASTTTMTIKSEYAATSAAAAMNFESGVFAFKTGTSATTALSLDSSQNATFAGDVTLSEGKVSITDTANETALSVTSSATSARVVDISCDSLLNGKGLRVDSNTVTTGQLFEVYSNSASTSTRKLGNFNNDNVLATGCTVLEVKQDAAQRALYIDQNGAAPAIEVDGGGIKFTNAVSDADANTLDDYEEGSWTPSLASGTSTGTAYYTKIGRLVHVFGTIAWATDGSGVSAINVTNLPFTCTKAATGLANGTVAVDGGDTWMHTTTSDGSAAMKFASSTSGSGVDASRWVSGASLSFNLTYYTS